MDDAVRNGRSWGRSSTYDVGADLLAGDLVVDDHLEGMGWGQLEIWSDVEAESSGSD